MKVSIFKHPAYHCWKHQVAPPLLYRPKKDVVQISITYIRYERCAVVWNRRITRCRAWSTNACRGDMRNMSADKNVNMSRIECSKNFLEDLNSNNHNKVNEEPILVSAWRQNVQIETVKL